MRRRAVTVFLLLSAVLGGLLTVVGPAQAVESNPPICTMILGGTEVTCSVPLVVGRTITSIDWKVDDRDVAQFKGFSQIMVGCPLGARFPVTLTLGFSSGDPSTGTTPVFCQGKPVRITFFDCDTGNSLVVCGVSFVDGTPPITVSWNVNGVPRPELTNNTVIRVGCVPGTPYRVVVTVRDALGSVSDVQSHTCSRTQQ